MTDYVSQPIIIIGAPRSGTSVLTWALGQHPNIALLPETVWFPIIAMAAQAAYGVGTERDKFSHLSNAQFPYDEFMASFGEAIDQIALKSFEKRISIHLPGFRDTRFAPPAWEHNKQPRLIHHPTEPKRRWVDGTPENTFSAYALSLIFPRARFVHIVRDPLSVATSLAHFDRAGTDAVVQDVEEGLWTWMRYTQAAHEIERALGQQRVFRIQNEHLREDGEGALRACLSFVGEDYAENCLLPLKAEMNSSKVTTEEKARIGDVVSGMSVYADAAALYRDVTGSAVPAEASEKTLGELRGTFEGRVGNLRFF